MTEERANPKRRRFLTRITTAFGLLGAAFAATPFVRSMTPSARARAAGAPVEVDITDLKPGEMITREWRGKPVWVLRRTPEMLESLKEVRDRLVDPDSSESIQPPYATNPVRAIKEEYFVVVGICTHLGCSPLPRLEPGADGGVGPDWKGGFFCPCHGSKFDLAGRVFKNVPAPTNLVVPQYTYLDNGKTILVGSDEGGQA